MAKRIPASVWLAASALGVVVALQTALALSFARRGQLGWGQFGFAALVAVLLLAGLLRGSRLAWLWGRWLALFLAVVVAARSAVALVRGEAPGWLAALVLGGIALPLAVAAVALGRRSAMAFYDLECPACRARSGTGADLLFRHARCRACGNVW